MLVLAKKRVAVAKDSWSAVAGGEEHRLTGLAEQFTLVGDSLSKLFPSGDVLAQALQTAVAQTVASGTAPPPALAMEVATGILYLDASLDDGELDQPELAERVQRLARAWTMCASAPTPAAGHVDGGAVPPRVRPPDHGQRGAGVAGFACLKSKSRSTSTSATRPSARC
jgi:hypothetical protein